MTKKEEFLRKVNEAFAESNMSYILEHVTDDIQWTVINDFSIRGKEKFIEAMNKMASEEPYSIDIKNIITHGDSAAVDGEMEAPDGKIYAFCDVYKFRGFKDPKIKKMTSYVIEVRQD